MCPEDKYVQLENLLHEMHQRSHRKSPRGEGKRPSFDVAHSYGLNGWIAISMICPCFLYDFKWVVECSLKKI